MARQRQAEVADAAVEIEQALVGGRLEQRQCTRDHGAVDGRVDLGEIRGPEGERQTLPGKRVFELDTFRREQRDAVGPARLQVDRKTVLRTERDELVAVGIGERHQIAQHQRRGVIPHAHLDLGDAVIGIETRDQRRQCLEPHADCRVQHLAARELRQIGTAPFAEPYQHPALPGDELHTEARLAPVAPCGAGERREPLARYDMADTLQVILQHLLLVADLRRCIEVLQAAAAAYAEVRTARHHPFRRGHEHLDRARFVEVPAPRKVCDAHFLARERTLDEHRLALHVRDPAPVVGQRLDAGRGSITGPRGAVR